MVRPLERHTHEALNRYAAQNNFKGGAADVARGVVAFDPVLKRVWVAAFGRGMSTQFMNELAGVVRDWRRT